MQNLGLAVSAAKALPILTISDTLHGGLESPRGSENGLVLKAAEAFLCV